MTPNDTRGPAGRLRIGEYIVFPESHEVVGPHGRRRVEPKVMAVLLCLAERPGEVVRRSDIVTRVWGEAGATDDVLSRCVSELRKAFGDDARRPRVIETIHRRGYRLQVPTPPAAAPARHAASRRRWIAVALVVATASLGAIAVLSKPGRRRDIVAPTVRPLTTDPGAEGDPAFSPDARSVAYVRRDSTAPGTRILVRSVAGGDPLELVPATAVHRSPSWSPDGLRVAFLRFGGIPTRCEVYVAALGGGDAELLAGCPAVRTRSLRWLPDATGLIVDAAESGNSPYAIYRYAFGNEGWRRLTDPPTGAVGDGLPALDAGGSELAFVRDAVEGVGDIYVLDLATARTRRLTATHRNVVGLDWTPDGGSLMLASDQGDRPGLWRLRVNGMVAERLAGGPEPMRQLRIASDGLHGVYTQVLLDADVWRAPIARGGAAEWVAPSTRWDGKPRLAPDNRVVFESNRGGTFELWLVDSTGTATALTSLGGPYNGSARWSPDGRRILLDGRPAGLADIYLLDVASRAIRRLTATPAQEVVPSWSRDGGSFYFASDRTGEWQVWRGAVAEPEGARPLTQHGGYTALEAPGGRFVYFTKASARGIWRVPVDGGPETLMTNALAAGDFDNWTVAPDGTLLLVRRPTGAEAVLSRYDPETGATSDLRVLGSDIPREPGGIDVSPDGRWVYYTRRTRTESDIMVLELAGAPSEAGRPDSPEPAVDRGVTPPITPSAGPS